LSPRAPRVSAAQTARVLERLGFTLVRQSGSHRIYRDAMGRRVTLPYHGSKTLHPKLLQSILADVGLTVEEFRRHLAGE
jgi:predicted RNA binding protein YcfA (HicA-like mRNA interferase family)